MAEDCPEPPAARSALINQQLAAISSATCKPSAMAVATKRRPMRASPARCTLRKPAKRIEHRLLGAREALCYEHELGRHFAPSCSPWVRIPAPTTRAHGPHPIIRKTNGIGRPQARIGTEQLFGFALAVALRVHGTRARPNGMNINLLRRARCPDNLPHAARALAQGRGHAVDARIAAADDRDVFPLGRDARLAALPAAPAWPRSGNRRRSARPQGRARHIDTPRARAHRMPARPPSDSAAISPAMASIHLRRKQTRCRFPPSASPAARPPTWEASCWGCRTSASRPAYHRARTRARATAPRKLPRRRKPAGPDPTTLTNGASAARRATGRCPAPTDNRKAPARCREWSPHRR